MRKLLTTTALVLGLCVAVPQDAEAHSAHSTVGVTVQIGWVWVPAHWDHGRFYRGSWKLRSTPVHRHRSHVSRHRQPHRAHQPTNHRSSHRHDSHRSRNAHRAR